MTSIIMLLDDFGNPIVGENETILVRDTISNTDFYVSKHIITLASEEPEVSSPIVETGEALDLPSGEPLDAILSRTEPIEAHHYADQSQQHDAESLRNHWTRNQILQLIESYKKHKDMFDNSTVRNSMVWNRIATDIGHHTGSEAMNKFKYLKARYTKKKDNMGATSSGAKAIHFEYFNLFDEIFGNDPNIIPLATASSSRVNREDVNNEEITAQATETPTSSPVRVNERKRKKDSLLEFLREKEEARERRHQETIHTLNIFNSLMERFLEQ